MDVRLTRYHPLRPVDWRYQKARNLLVKNGRPTCHEGKDPWKDQFRFFNKLGGCRDEYSRSRLMRESPRLWFAFELHCDTESGLRAVIEARLLAGETFSSIGAKIGFTGFVIETYAQCFFDVQTRLSHVDFIHSHVLNRNVQGNREGAERELALKRIGFCAGVLVQRVYMTHLGGSISIQLAMTAMLLFREETVQYRLCCHGDRVPVPRFFGFDSALCHSNVEIVASLGPSHRLPSADISLQRTE